jgi:endoplasmic reticulum junction formation protein lunapark
MFCFGRLMTLQSGEDAASFEKTLSTLTAKISRAAARNDGLRQRSRRVRVMWTLYAGFAYILAALLLVLVTGWKNWGATEISVVAGGPVL